MELVKIVDCFLDAHGNYDSNLESFRKKIFINNTSFVTVSKSNDCSQRLQNASKNEILKQKISSFVRF